MTIFSFAMRDMLLGLLRSLESEDASERLVHVDVLCRFIRDTTLDWDDLLVAAEDERGTPPSAFEAWHEAAQCCLLALRLPDFAGCCNAQETTFLRTISLYDRKPSFKQLDWLDDIVNRLEAKACPWRDLRCAA